jgi:hypothetical protein
VIVLWITIYQLWPQSLVLGSSKIHTLTIHQSEVKKEKGKATSCKEKVGKTTEDNRTRLHCITLYHCINEWNSLSVPPPLFSHTEGHICKHTQNSFRFITCFPAKVPI